MAHGVVPAAKLSVLGVLNQPANGYATHNEGNEEETTSLLQPSGEQPSSSNPGVTISADGSTAARIKRLSVEPSQQQPSQQRPNTSNGHWALPFRDRQQPPRPGPTFESLDYEVVENTVYRADQASQSELDGVYSSAAKWGLCFLLGIITATAAFAVNFGVENLSGFKFAVTLRMVDSDWLFGSWLVYSCINCALVGASTALTVYVAPAAAGSGIAEVKAYLNGINVPGLFMVKTLVVKIIGSMGAVAGGLAIGKEGPFVHAGACIGALLSQGGSMYHHLPWFKRFWNDRDRSDMVACGAAAGVAAAFRSPVGGVLFALEEMTTWWRNQLLWFAFFTTAVVSVAVRMMMTLCVEGSRCGFFGNGGFIVYEIEDGQDAFEVSELLPVLLLGVIGGLAGSCFDYLSAHLARLRKRHLARYGPRGRVLEGLAVALLTSTVSFLMPLMVTCQPCPAEAGAECPRNEGATGNYINFGCAHKAQYNDLATILFNTQDDAIRNLFSSRTKSEYSIGSLLTFTPIFYALAVLSYGLSVPTGLFVPSILTGAAYGRLVGIFVADMHPAHNIDEGTYALLGAASFLGGCMRLTVCTCVMLLELTNNLALLPLVMMVLLVAKAVGDGTGVKPIYEALIDVKELPYLEAHPDGLMRHISVREACGRPAVSFQRVERVGTILDTLRGTAHNAFPVIAPSGDGDAHIMGVVLRSHLLVLLRSRRCFQPSSFVSEAASRVAFSYHMAEFASPISEGGPGLEQVVLSNEQLGMFLDLGPYVNPSYYVVQEDMSLSKVYTLFRTLGLRHLAVIPRANQVTGIITRADLLSRRLEEQFLDQHLPRGAGVAGLAGAMRTDGGHTVRDALESLALGVPPEGTGRSSVVGRANGSQGVQEEGAYASGSGAGPSSTSAGAGVAATEVADGWEDDDDNVTGQLSRRSAVRNFRMSGGGKGHQRMPQLR